MFKLERRHFLITGLITAAASFILILIGFKAVLGEAVSLKNITVYLGFSLIAGIASAVLVYFRLKIAFLCFTIGLAVGFILMFKTFLNGLSGWGDLVGAFLLISLAIMGLGVGISAQYGLYLYKKLKSQASKDMRLQ